jgi:hypothetical protein
MKLLFIYAALALHLGADALLAEIAIQSRNQRMGSLARMMRDLVETLSDVQLQPFVAAASDLVAEWWVVEALTDTLLRVDGEAEILRVLRASRAIVRTDLRSRLAARAVDRLAECGHVEGAIAAGIYVDLTSERWSSLCNTVEALSAKGRFREAVIFTDTIVSQEERGRAQAMMCLHMARLGKRKQAIVVASGIGSEVWRAWTDTHLRTLTASEAWDTQGAVEVCSEATKLQTASEGDSWLKNLALLARYNVAWSSLLLHIQGESPHPELARFWDLPCPKSGLRFFDCFQRTGRRQFVKEMRHLIPVIARFGAKEDLLAIEQATREVSGWWR